MNTRRIKTYITTALLPLAAMSGLTHVNAAHADPAMNACIRAFVSTNLEKERPVVIRKVEPAGAGLHHYSRREVIQITAKTTRGGKELAKATCTVDGKDVVLTSEGAPATTMSIDDALASLSR
jgi:hypothetical protein